MGARTGLRSRETIAEGKCWRCKHGAVERHWLSIGLCGLCWLIGRARSSS